jgi:hypothetical protein
MGVSLGGRSDRSDRRRVGSKLSRGRSCRENAVGRAGMQPGRTLVQAPRAPRRQGVAAANLSGLPGFDMRVDHLSNLGTK